jgi:BioD-like phosphotransacetylase family protein
VARDTEAEVVVGERYLDNMVERLIVGAMTAHRALDYLAPGVLMITGGDRDDLVLATIGMSSADSPPGKAITGIILTGGMTPHKAVQEVIARARFPVLMHPEDSYTVATMVNHLVAKIQIQDTAKHQLAIQMVRQHVDVDRLLSLL